MKARSLCACTGGAGLTPLLDELSFASRWRPDLTAGKQTWHVQHMLSSGEFELGAGLMAVQMRLCLRVCMHHCLLEALCFAWSLAIARYRCRCCRRHSRHDSTSSTDRSRGAVLARLLTGYSAYCLWPWQFQLQLSCPQLQPLLSWLAKAAGGRASASHLLERRPDLVGSKTLPPW